MRVEEAVEVEDRRKKTRWLSLSLSPRSLLPLGTRHSLPLIFAHFLLFPCFFCFSS